MPASLSLQGDHRIDTVQPSRNQNNLLGVTWRPWRLGGERVISHSPPRREVRQEFAKQNPFQESKDLLLSNSVIWSSMVATRTPRFLLLVAQSRHGIDLRGPPRGEVAGRNCHGRPSERDLRVGNRIGRRYAVKHAV